MIILQDHISNSITEFIRIVGRASSVILLLGIIVYLILKRARKNTEEQYNYYNQKSYLVLSPKINIEIEESDTSLTQTITRCIEISFHSVVYINHRFSDYNLNIDTLSEVYFLHLAYTWYYLDQLDLFKVAGVKLSTFSDIAYSFVNTFQDNYTIAEFSSAFKASFNTYLNEVKRIISGVEEFPEVFYNRALTSIIKEDEIKKPLKRRLVVDIYLDQLDIVREEIDGILSIYKDLAF